MKPEDSAAQPEQLPADAQGGDASDVLAKAPPIPDIQVSIGNDGQRVLIQFGQPVSVVRMDPKMAERVLKRIQQELWALKRKRREQRRRG